MISIASSPREDYVRKAGYRAFNYSGRVSDAPSKIKHIARDLQPGWYLYRTGKDPVYGPLGTPYSTETDIFEEGFYHLLADDLYVNHNIEIVVENDGYRAKRKSRFGGSVSVLRKPSDNEYEELMKAALHVGIITKDFMQFSNEPRLFSTPHSALRLTSTDDTYGVYTEDGALIAIVSHGVGGFLGQPKDDAELYAQTIRMYNILYRLVKVSDPADILKVQQEAQSLLNDLR